jgi:hypothetical protein
MDFPGIRTQIIVVIIVIVGPRRVTSPDMRERSADDSPDKRTNGAAD